MSQSASQASAFYKEVARTQVVWALSDDEGFPMVTTATGHTVVGFWSSKSRVEKVIREVPGYQGFYPVEIAWDEFVTRWIKRMRKDKLLVGVNWSGTRLTGYDIGPLELLENVKSAITCLPK